MTPAQRWRFRRDLVMHVASTRGNVPRAVLADVFGLGRTRTRAILLRQKAEEEKRRGKSDGGP